MCSWRPESKGSDPSDWDGSIAIAETNAPTEPPVEETEDDFDEDLVDYEGLCGGAHVGVWMRSIAA